MYLSIAYYSTLDVIFVLPGFFQGMGVQHCLPEYTHIYNEGDLIKHHIPVTDCCLLQSNKNAAIFFIIFFHFSSS